MKTIYLVRHAESEANTGPLRSSPSTPLTAKGVGQAQYLGRRLKNFPIEVVLTSESVRARDTATILSKELQVDLIESSLFNERKKPSQLEGLPKKSMQANEIDLLIRTNFNVDGFRFSDEENFHDIYERVMKGLDYILKLPNDHIVVVTHGMILRYLLGVVIHGSGLTPELSENFFRSVRMENTGITIIRENSDLTEEGAASPMQLWVWNDHAHLADP